MKAANKCIFCHGSGLTKEHFWPKWMDRYINQNKADYNISAIYSSEGKALPTLDRYKKRPGDVTTKKFRVVCHDCNNNWMSRMEEKAKPILLNIFEKKRFNISPSDFIQLSTWIVLKVMVAEQAEKGTQVTPEGDLQNFYLNSAIPNYYCIYVGRQESGNSTGYLRNTATLCVKNTFPDPPLNGLQRNIQSVAFIIGPLFVFVIAARVNGLNPAKLFNIKGMECIWPAVHSEIDWPIPKGLSKREMSSVAFALESLIAKPNCFH